MEDLYEAYLQRAKKLNYSIEKYAHLEEVIAVAKKAGLLLNDPLEITDKFEFAISLATASALFESYKTNGNDGCIIYCTEEDELVKHYADNRVKSI